MDLIIQNFNLFLPWARLKKCVFKILFLSSPKDILSLLLGREGRREANIDARERSIDWSFPYSLRLGITCGPGVSLQPRYVPWPGIKPTAFPPRDDTSATWAIPARAKCIFLKQIYLVKNGVGLMFGKISLSEEWSERKNIYSSLFMFLVVSFT